MMHYPAGQSTSSELRLCHRLLPDAENGGQCRADYSRQPHSATFSHTHLRDDAKTAPNVSPFHKDGNVQALQDEMTVIVAFSILRASPLALAELQSSRS